jgi:hypothetical protein
MSVRAPLPDPPVLCPLSTPRWASYPTGSPINRLSSRNTPTTKIPINPRAIQVLTLSGTCSHRSKSRSHHLSSPSPSRSSTMPPRPNPIPCCVSARMLDYFSPSEFNPQWRVPDSRSGHPREHARYNGNPRLDPERQSRLQLDPAQAERMPGRIRVDLEVVCGCGLFGGLQHLCTQCHDLVVGRWEVVDP